MAEILHIRISILIFRVIVPVEIFIVTVLICFVLDFGVRRRGGRRKVFVAEPKRQERLGSGLRESHKAPMEVGMTPSPTPRRVGDALISL
jgi:hypothetical protein